MDGFLSFANLRSYPRDDIVVEACVLSRGETIKGTTVDVSLNGIGLDVPNADLKPGEVVSVQVVMGALGSRWHEAMVRWRDGDRVGCQMLD